MECVTLIVPASIASAASGNYIFNILVNDKIITSFADSSQFTIPAGTYDISAVEQSNGTNTDVGESRSTRIPNGECYAVYTPNTYTVAITCDGTLLFNATSQSDTGHMNIMFNHAKADQPPTISTPGDTTIHAGDSFDPMRGVTATDDVDGDLTAQITVNGTVDVNTPGSYRLSYSVSDSAGNVGAAERSITVVSAGTTIACAPQTGDPAASVWQWTALFGAVMCLVLAGVAFRMRRMAGRLGV